LAEDLLRAQASIDEAYQSDVTHIFTIGTNFIESENCVKLARHYKNVHAVVGIHPNDCTENWKKELDEIRELVKNKKENKIIAIGECGLDKHYPGYNISRQKDAFRAQIEVALEHNLPLVVHTRDAQDEVLHCIEEYTKNGLRGVIHCFSETLSFAQDALDKGFVMGIGGTITYPKNSILREVVQALPLHGFILETDAPFLPPQSLRGKQNKPAYIRLIADYIAELRGISASAVATATTKTVQALFKLTV